MYIIMDAGFVYCVTCSTYATQNIYKIGATSNIKARLGNFNTHSPEDYYVVFQSKLLINKFDGENFVFESLEKYKYRREFYKCDPDIIKNAFSSIPLEFIHGPDIVKQVPESGDDCDKYFDEKQPIVDNQKETYTCIHCDKELTRPSGLTYHLSICKVKIKMEKFIGGYKIRETNFMNNTEMLMKKISIGMENAFNITNNISNNIPNIINNISNNDTEMRSNLVRTENQMDKILKHVEITDEKLKITRMENNAEKISNHDNNMEKLMGNMDEKIVKHGESVGMLMKKQMDAQSDIGKIYKCVDKIDKQIGAQAENVEKIMKHTEEIMKHNEEMGKQFEAHIENMKRLYKQTEKLEKFEKRFDKLETQINKISNEQLEDIFDRVEGPTREDMMGTLIDITKNMVQLKKMVLSVSKT